MKEILLLIIGAALGWIGQWFFYRYQRRDEQRQGPSIVTSKIVRHERIVFELRNIGRDSLSEMDVNISWFQAGHEEHRQLRAFFLPDQDFRTASPMHVELVGPGERYIASELPQWSDDGIVNVTVAGFGVTSHQQYSSESQIVVSLPPTAAR